MECQGINCPKEQPGCFHFPAELPKDCPLIIGDVQRLADLIEGHARSSGGDDGTVDTVSLARAILAAGYVYCPKTESVPDAMAQLNVR